MSRSQPDLKSSQDFRLKFWGVRGSYPTVDAATLGVGGNTSCVEVRVDGRRLIFDAGTGIIPLGKELCNGAAAPPAAYVFLSHTHIDHVLGLCFFEPLADSRSAYIYSRSRRHSWGADAKFAPLDQQSSFSRFAR